MILAFVCGSICTFCFLYAWLRNNLNDKVVDGLGQTKSRRQLDELEVFLYNLEKTGTGTVGNILCLTSRIHLSPTLVTQALAALTRRHPLLRAKIVEFEEENVVKKYFDVMDSGDIVIPLKNLPLDASQWKKAWEERLYGKIFERHGLLWSASILQEEFDSDSKTYRNTLIFVLHHSIADGISGVRFTKQFVIALNQLSEYIDNNAKPRDSTILSEHQSETTPDSLPLLPSAFSLISHKIGYSSWQKALRLPWLFGVMFKFAIRLQAKMKPRNLLLEAFIESSEKDCSPQDHQAIVERELSEQKTSLLIETARKHNTTVNGVLTAASQVALCEVLQANRPSVRPPKTMDMISTASIRKECFPVLPEGCIGNFAILMTTPMPFVEGDNNDILSLAKDYTEQIRKTISSGSHLLLHRVFESIGGDTFGQITDSISSAKQEINPQALTNLGHYETSLRSGSFEVSKLFFTVTMCHSPDMATTMFCNEVVMFNGRLYWVTSYDHTLVGRRQAEDYASKVFEKIDSVIS